MKQKMKRFDEGGEIDDVETTTDEEGNEVTIARRGYTPKAAVKKAAPSRGRSVSQMQAAKKAPSVDMSLSSYDRKEMRHTAPDYSSYDRKEMRHTAPDYSSYDRKEGRYPVRMKSGGSVKSSASRRADGIAKRGKTKGRML